MEMAQILEGEKPASVTETPEPAETKPEPKADRDDKGRFAKGETAEPPAAKTETEHEPERVPVKAVQEERRKRQELERELADLKQRLSTPPPDPVENPGEYAAHLQAGLQFQSFNDRLNISQAMAEEKYGAEAVLEAQELFKQAAMEDPSLTQRLHVERHPYAWVMKWAKNRQFMTEMGDDPEAYWQKRLSAERAKWESENKPLPKTPSPSLASAPSAAVSQTAYQGPRPLNKIFGK